MFDFRPWLRLALCVALCVASGTLECASPEPLSPAQARGATLYGRMCAVCHGRFGDGYLADQAPALAHPDFLASVTDLYLQTAISQGRAGTTMSAWSTARGGPLSREDVDAIVAFLRSWASGPAVALDERLLVGDAAAGADIFARECARCHGPHGTTGPNVRIGNPELLATASNGFLRYAIRRGRPGTAMPGFEAGLGETGIENALALVRSWQLRPLAAPPAMPAPPPPLPLGPVPLNPQGPEPQGFHGRDVQGGTTGVDVVKAQLDRGARMAVLDARAPSDYAMKHIAGAVSVPFYDPDPYVPQLPRNAWLVCYCSCPHAESGQLAQKLLASGFTKVTVLDEGLGVWDMRNYPTHTGISP
jgi:cytochrome c oxidase cbb3-type subunit 3/ubiquinol-cytochrome c reductase cytochrome c subunit